MMVLLMAIAMSCEKVERLDFDPSTPPPSTSDWIGVQILPSADGLQKAFLIEDTVWAQINTVVNFLAVDNGLNITSWSWSFDGGQALSGSQNAYEFYTLGLHWLHLVGFYGNNQQTSADIPIWIVEDISTIDPVRLISCQDLGAGVYSVTFGIAKERTRWISGTNTFFYTGNMTSPIWTTQIIPPADTSYNIAFGPPPSYTPSLVLPPIGDNGYCYGLRNLNSVVGMYDLGTGKIKNSQQLWLNFSGSAWVESSNPTMIKYKILPGGTVVPNVAPPTNLPGTIGDEGPNAVIRFDLGENAAIVYFHNSTVFNGSQFFKFYDEYNLGETPITQSSVAGFPYWGKCEIAYTANSIQPSGLVVMKFGENISAPTAYNENMDLSMYYDPVFWNLRFFLKKVSALNKDGQIETIPQLRLAPVD